MVGRKIWAIAIITAAILQVASSTKQLKVDDEDETCSNYEVIRVDESSDYNVLWTGNQPPKFCKFGFLGAGRNSFDKYKVCVEVLTYLITDCSVALRYDTRVDGTYMDMEHKCGTSPPKICGDENEKLDIELISANNYETLESYPSTFSLRITSIKTFEYAIFVATISASVIGSVILITIVTVVLVVWCKLYRKRKKMEEPCKSKSAKADKHKPYTVPVNSEINMKRAPSYSTISSEYENNPEQLLYLPYSVDHSDKTAHIY